MSEMYFTREPTSASKPAGCTFVYRGRTLRFQTDAGVFSRGELDPGTRLLLDCLPALSGRILDLGCGWGPIGIAVASAEKETDVVMADVNLRALALTRQNARDNGVQVEAVESDGFSGLSGSFSAILTNPPIRAGKQVIYRLFAESEAHLLPGACLYLVIRKQQGAESCLKYLRSIYASADVLKKSGGYWILRAAKAKEKEAADENGSQLV